MRRAGFFLRLAAGLSFVNLGFSQALPGAPPPEVSPAEPSPAELSPPDLSDVRAALAELDLARAESLLGRIRERTPEVLVEAARLAVHRGDCAGAEKLVARLSVEEGSDVGAFRTFVGHCAGAIVGSVVVHDAERGIWIRLQDGGDRVLVPWILDVAVRARAAMERDLDVRLPRPLRIELVRDHFSLSRVSGLPIEAAETTGTVAVARYGRVIMISPRAASHGYPWQDTLAHELAHLSLTRKTRDFAPLWLQEGVAKIQETAWREPHVLEAPASADDAAFVGLLSGRAIAVDRMGPSIAMLPTAEDAAAAFAAVESFLRFWIRRNGMPALWLLLSDLAQLENPDPNPALLSVTGYPLDVWLELWRRELFETARAPEARPTPYSVDAGRLLRLAELMLSERLAEPAVALARRAVERMPDAALPRVLEAEALLASDRPWAARSALASMPPSEERHGPFLALKGRFELESGRPAEARAYLDHAVSLNPFSELVACAGRSARSGLALKSSLERRRATPGRAGHGAPRDQLSGEHQPGFEWWPLGDEQRTLCEAVRAPRASP